MNRRHKNVYITHITESKMRTYYYNRYYVNCYIQLTDFLVKLHRERFDGSNYYVFARIPITENLTQSQMLEFELTHSKYLIYYTDA